MWEFLGSVLRQHGLAAVVILAALAGCAYAIRALWTRNKELATQLTTASKEHEQSIKAIEVEHQKTIRKLIEDADRVATTKQEEFAGRLMALQEKRREELEKCARRIDDLQEKRMSEIKEVVVESTKNVVHTRTSVEKISAAMDVLTDVMARRT